MNMKKRLISLLLALGLAASLAVPAVAAEDKLYQIEDGYSVAGLIPSMDWVMLSGNDSKVVELNTGLQVKNYDYAEDCGKCIIVGVGGDKYGLLDTNGTPLTGMIYRRMEKFGADHVRVWDENKKVGVLDYQGKVVVPLKYDDIAGYDTYGPYANEWGFVEGMTTVTLNGKIGFVNEQGVEVVAPQYDSACPFSDGMAVVGNPDVQYGAIDKTGKLVIPMQYEFLYDFKGGLAGVYIDGKYGFLDKTGKLAIPAVYDGVYESGFKTGVAAVYDNGRDYPLVFIDKTGKVIGDSFDYNFYEEGADPNWLLDDEKWIVCQHAGTYNYDVAVYDLTGKCVIPFGTYTDIRFNRDVGVAVAVSAVWSDDGEVTSDVVYLDKDLKVIDLPYEACGAFHSGLAAAMVSDENGYLFYGYINEKLKVAIPAIYTWGGDFSCGLACVGLTDADGTERFGYINASGDMVIPARYSSASAFSEGIALVRSMDGERDIYINTKGEEIYSLSQDWDNGFFKNGVAKTANGLIDREGNLLAAGSVENLYQYYGEATAYWTVNGNSIYINPYFGADSLNAFEPTQTYAGQFGDVPEKAWYASAVGICYEYGLMTGASKDSFAPTGKLTVAQAITMASRVHEIYHTGERNLKNGKPWYQTYVDYALANGIIKAGEFTADDYGRNITRAEMAGIFARAVDAVDLYPINSVSAVPDVTAATPYADEILTLYRAGVLTGADGGKFYPGNDIARSEAAAILARIILPEQRKSVSF